MKIKTSRRYGVFAYAVVTLAAGSVSILIARHLTVEQYAEYVKTASLVVLLPNLANFGLNYKIIREPDVLKALEYFKLSIRTTIVFFVLISPPIFMFYEGSALVLFPSFLTTVAILFLALATHIPKPGILLLAQIISSALMVLGVITLLLLNNLTPIMIVTLSSICALLGPLMVVLRNYSLEQFKYINKKRNPNWTVISLRDGIVIQCAQIPVPSFISSLPLIASLFYDVRDVALLGISLTYGTLIQSFGNFMTANVYVPNLISDRRLNESWASLRNETKRQYLLVISVSSTFLMTTTVIGERILVFVVGREFAGSQSFLVVTSAMYIGTILLAVFVTPILLFSRIAYVGTVQCLTLLILVTMTYFANIFELTLVTWLSLLTLGFIAMSVVIGFSLNRTVYSRLKI